jgi:hypothetical protein
MAPKWLQSAVYPPAQPKLQTGLEQAEVDADFARLEVALRRPFRTEENYGQEAEARLRRSIRGD